MYKLSIIMACIGFINCNNRISYPDGGYDYPTKINPKDTNFYFYPLKDIEPKKDSFNNSFTYKTFKAFNEPNLSLTPCKMDVFRFYYEGWTQKTVIISLIDHTITIKQGYPGQIYGYSENNLSEVEIQHLHLLQRYFPITETNVSYRRKRYLDSMVKVWPKLLDPFYYKLLTEKTFSPPLKPFTYSISHVLLSNDRYNYLISLINNSGYWSLPYNIDCNYPPTDGYGFILEANTLKKYKVVSSGGCPDDSTKFTKACQALIEYAHMQKTINLIWSGAIDTANITFPEVKLEEIKPPARKKIHKKPVILQPR